MMYFENRAIFYTVLAAELLHKDYEEVYKTVFPIFLCKENHNLIRILKNEVFQKLRSSLAIQMQKNFVRSFCMTPSAFGMKDAEFTALDIRQNAFSLIEELSSDVTCADPLIKIAKLQKERGVCAALLVLLLHIQGRYDNRCEAILSKTLKAGDLDAGIILLALTENSCKEAVCREIYRLPEAIFYPEVEVTLKDSYLKNNSMGRAHTDTN